LRRFSRHATRRCPDLDFYINMTNRNEPKSSLLCKKTDRKQYVLRQFNPVHQKFLCLIRHVHMRSYGELNFYQHPYKTNITQLQTPSAFIPYPLYTRRHRTRRRSGCYEGEIHRSETVIIKLKFTDRSATHVIVKSTEQSRGRVWRSG
jgi:hypothetical protein